MQNKVRFIGLDVHKETIMIAVAEPNGVRGSVNWLLNES